MKKNIFIISGLLLINSLVFSQSKGFEEYVDSKYVDELRNNGSVCVIHPKEENKFSIIPDTMYKNQIEQTILPKDAKGVPFVAEFIYLIPKSKLIEGTDKTNVTIQDTSVVFRSVSKMQGMKYHFAEKKNGDVLYKKSYRIENPDSFEPIPDYTEGSADGFEAYCYQDDHTYGDTKYKLNYYQNEEQLFAKFESTLPMSYLGVKAIMAGNLKLNILCIDCGENLLLYLTTDANAKSVPLFNVRKQIQDSMTERIDAIYRWFMVQFK